ncbi:histidine phosphatase family protein [Pseudomonas sp. MAP12]|uniref:Histidine phosphatase family protein n=1 Tax=Geopseudomonas aromaticivorans TaxID=2849492 RepID=A0ABS6MX55_9GAMM|nr:histidine phosphatase family protein [Pseudomonas aromaticivorans]MBV2133396.1 histidine phosphatase family protein [Pseudomonas aromaticivorans]
MKVLFLVRHGQSSWDDVKLADRDRPLTDKGKSDAVKMGKRLAESEVALDMIVSSPAQRALATAETIARKLDFKRKSIVQDERLYSGQVDDLLRLIREVGDDHKRVMLAGHNPLLSELVLELADKDVNLPTCAVAILRFDTKSWAKIGRKKLEKVVIKYS